MKKRVLQQPWWQWLLVSCLSLIFLLLLIYSNLQQASQAILSDLATHTFFALSGGSNYSLLHVLIAFFYHIGDGALLLSIFLAAMSLLAVWAGWALLRQLAPIVHPLLLFVVSLACNIEMSLYVPWVGPLYLGSYGAGIWHNPTYTILKPLAVLCFLYFLRVWKNYREGVFWKDYTLLTVMLTLSTWAKPSFVMSFGPVLVILLVWDFVRHRGKKIVRTVIFGLCMLPSCVVALAQSMVLFDDENSVAFGYGVFLSNYTPHPLWSLLKSIVFPVLILAVCHWIGKNGAALSTALLNAALALVYAFFLFEDGSRIYDGNFTWGAHVAIFLLFLVTAGILFQWQAEKMVLATGTVGPKAGFWVCCAALALHALVGIGYFFRFTFIAGHYLF